MVLRLLQKIVAQMRQTDWKWYKYWLGQGPTYMARGINNICYQFRQAPPGIYVPAPK